MAVLLVTFFPLLLRCPRLYIQAEIFQSALAGRHGALQVKPNNPVLLKKSYEYLSQQSSLIVTFSERTQRARGQKEEGRI